MKAYRCEATVDESGQLRLSQLPFLPGEEVEVIVLPRRSEARSENPYPLRGLAYRYDDPTAPLIEDD